MTGFLLKEAAFVLGFNAAYLLLLAIALPRGRRMLGALLARLPLSLPRTSHHAGWRHHAAA